VDALLERDGATAAARMREHLLNVQWRMPTKTVQASATTAISTSSSEEAN
jgi:DNA-binding GntR family transcriptional regulator